MLRVHATPVWRDRIQEYRLCVRPDHLMAMRLQEGFWAQVSVAILTWIKETQQHCWLWLFSVRRLWWKRFIKRTLTKINIFLAKKMFGWDSFCSGSQVGFFRYWLVYWEHSAEVQLQYTISSLPPNVAPMEATDSNVDLSDNADDQEPRSGYSVSSETCSHSEGSSQRVSQLSEQFGTDSFVQV